MSYVLIYMRQSKTLDCFSCALCFCLLVAHIVYFNNFISQVAEIFRDVHLWRKCIQIDDMYALYATQTLDIYDVTETHIHVIFKKKRIFDFFRLRSYLISPNEHQT